MALRLLFLVLPCLTSGCCRGACRPSVLVKPCTSEMAGRDPLCRAMRLRLTLESVARELNSVGRHRRPGLAFGRWDTPSVKPALRRGAGRQNPSLAPAGGLVGGVQADFELKKDSWTSVAC